MHAVVLYAPAVQCFYEPLQLNCYCLGYWLQCLSQQFLRAIMGSVGFSVKSRSRGTCFKKVTCASESSVFVPRNQWYTHIVFLDNQTILASCDAPECNYQILAFFFFFFNRQQKRTEKQMGNGNNKVYNPGAKWGCCCSFFLFQYMAF